jgi:uncharacterized damage-inducible protein DinB
VATPLTLHPLSGDAAKLMYEAMMKLRISRYLSGPAMLLALGAPAVHGGAQTPCSAGSAHGQSLATSWRGVRDYTLAVVASMPDSLLDFRPATASRTFHEQVVHLSVAALGMSQAISTQVTNVTIDTSSGGHATLARNVTTALDAVINAHLTVCDDRWLDPIPWASPGLTAATITRRQVAEVARDHLAHHRGQLVVYLRLNGITPPPYVGF